MKTLPTDLQILNTIFETYQHEYEAYSKETPNRATKVYVPIEIELIAKKLDTEVDIVFGRLYYYMEEKYSYRNRQDAIVHFFTLGVKDERHCIHFPYMASILAQLRDNERKMRVSTWISIIALIVSIASVLVAVK